MPDLLKNTYTLIACIVTVCTLGSFGGVSLYIIQEGFADQSKQQEEIALLKSVALSRAELIKYNSREIDRLRVAVDDLRESR